MSRSSDTRSVVFASESSARLATPPSFSPAAAIALWTSSATAALFGGGSTSERCARTLSASAMAVISARWSASRAWAAASSVMRASRSFEWVAASRAALAERCACCSSFFDCACGGEGGGRG